MMVVDSSIRKDVLWGVKQCVSGGDADKRPAVSDGDGLSTGDT